MTVRILTGDCRTVLPQLAAEGLQAHCCVTDPPYHLTTGKKGGTGPASVNLDNPYGRARITTGFMGQAWDGGDVALRAETWAAVAACLRPGAHLVAFGGTRTWHRMAVAIEDAGFEIRDTLCWLYGVGFPKSHDVSKGIDKAAGAEREVVGPGARHNSKRCAVAHGDTERLAGGVPDITAPATSEAAAWEGWGTALKPAWESIILAVKPLEIRREWVTICSELFRLWGQLWSALPANAAAESSALNPAAYGAERFGSAPCNAESACSTPDVSCGRMDTSQFVSATISALSTVCSWNATLAARCSHESMSITGTESNTTTDLRTLKFSLSKITPHTITQAHRSGAWSNADACPAAQYLNASVVQWNATRELSALASAIELEQHCSPVGDVSLSPNFEPIILARKPLAGTVAGNVLAHGTGALNIDGCRGKAAPGDYDHPGSENMGVAARNSMNAALVGNLKRNKAPPSPAGRWPANVIHDGSEEVEAAFARFGERASGQLRPEHQARGGFAHPSCYHSGSIKGGTGTGDANSGSASRFFYAAKADTSDRAGSKHPTVKPTSLMRWLVQLVCPPNGLVLDPFAGTGSTGLAADQLGFDAVLIERDPTYTADARRKVESDAPLFAEVAD